MKRLIKKLEDIMVAVTFAEAGEFDEARKESLKIHEEEADLLAAQKLASGNVQK